MSETIVTKKCSKCKEIKPFSEFYKDARHKDGHQSQCKICFLEAQKSYRQSEKGRAYQKSYQKRYEQSENGKERHKRADRKYRQTEKGKVLYRKLAKNARKENPEKIEARKAVNHAIRVGRLPQPGSLLCHYYLQKPDCEKQAKEYHHHKGYAPEHWLDVIPVCIKCHLLFR